MRRLLWVVCLFAAVVCLFAAVGCGGSDAEIPLIERGVVLLEFWGSVRDGDVVLHQMEASDGNAGIDGTVPGGAEQALVRIREDRNGTPGTAGAIDGIELVVERAAPYAAPATVANGCGVGVDSFEMNVTVRNFFATAINNVYAEINQLSSPQNALCNSDNNTPNLLIDGAPLAVANGLVRYGHLSRDPDGPATPPSSTVPPPLGTDLTAQTMLWRFGAGTGTFDFRGRVVADICAIDCPPGAIAQEGPNVPLNNAFPVGDTNGTVEAVAEGLGVGYVAGSFSAVGPVTGAAFSTVRAPTTAGSGKAQTPWAPFIGGAVRALEPDGQGGFYAGGNFTRVGNLVQPRLVHVLADGTVDTSFVPPATVTGSNGVRALLLDTSVSPPRLWVGRSTAPFLSVLDANTGADLVTLPNLGDQVFDIARGGDVVAVVGEFRNVAGDANRDKVALFNRAGVLQPFSLQVSGNSSISVDAVHTDGVTVWIAGEFQTINGVTRRRLAAARVSDGALLAWNPDASGTVRAMQIVGGGASAVAYVGGLFTSVNGVTRNRLAAVDANPAVASPTVRAWNPNASATVNAIAVDGADVYVAGTFTTIAGGTRTGFAAVSANPDAAGTLRTWNPVVGTSTNHVLAIDAAGDRVLCGGSFSFGGWIRRNNVAAWDLQTGAFLDTWDANVNGPVRALALAGGTLYLGGAFSQVGGVARQNLAAVDAGSGALATGFVANASGAVEALAASGSHLYVGGTFATLGGNTTLENLGRVALTTGAVDGSWLPATNNTVHALALSGADVFAGGAFTTINGAPAGRLARLTTTSAAVATNFNANNDVRGLAVSRGLLYAAGNFTSIAGAARTRAAAIDLRTQTLLTTFNATVDNIVQSVAAAGAAVVLGGNFQNVGGQARRAVAVVDATTGGLFPSAPLNGAATPAINAVAVIAGNVVAGGLIGTTPQPVVTAGTTTAPSVRTSLAVVNGD